MNYTSLGDALNEVHDGWKEIVTRCYEACVKHDVEILQIKEKFGGLRFYVGQAPDIVHDIIAKAESESLKTCERCGEPGTLTGTHWVLTLCKKCDKKSREGGQ